MQQVLASSGRPTQALQLQALEHCWQGCTWASRGGAAEAGRRGMVGRVAPRVR